MKLIKWLIFLLIIAALTVTFTPLDLYYKNIAKKIRPIQLKQINGSAVKGSAATISYMGMDLGQGSWLVYPGSYDKLNVDFTLENKGYDLKGTYERSFKNSSESIKNLTGSIDWSMIDDKINFSRGKIKGYLDLDFQRLEMRKGVPHEIIGTIVTKDLKLVNPIKKDLGEVEVVFTSDNPQIIVGQVNSNSNVLNISGAIYIHKNHRWEVKLTLIPMPGQYEIDYALQGIGDKRRGGGRSLNMAGFY